MNSTEFIDSIKSVVVETAVDSIKSNLIKPPGKKPSEKLQEMSEWYNNIGDNDKAILLQIIRESVETSIFGFLCVLDGVRIIEDSDEKGKLLLYYEKNGNRQLLNDPNEEYLHDQF